MRSKWPEWSLAAAGRLLTYSRRPRVFPLPSTALGHDQPRISVIIANVNGLPSIAECLAHLGEQDGEHDLEIVVVDACSDGSGALIRKEYPEVLHVPLDRRPGIPEMRAIGLAHASGDVVAIIEDHCMVRPNWLNAIEAGLATGVDAVGGPVENACTERLVDRAVYLTEYAGMMAPMEPGEGPGIAGNNAAYRRALFEIVSKETLEQDWEFFVQQEMLDYGARFLRIPEMVVDHKKEFGFWYFVRQRFHYSRSFAGMRRRRVASVKRAVYALASPLLMPLMLYRIGRQVVAKRREETTFIASLPLLFPFMASYAAGEFVGYLFGGGQSLERVE